MNILILILLLVIVYNILVIKEKMSPMTTVKIKHKEITEKIQNVKDKIDKMMDETAKINQKATLNNKSIKKTSDGTDKMLCEISDVCK